jgi:hypothetical protein
VCGGDPRAAGARGIMVRARGGGGAGGLSPSMKQKRRHPPSSSPGARASTPLKQAFKHDAFDRAALHPRSRTRIHSPSPLPTRTHSAPSTQLVSAAAAAAHRAARRGSGGTRRHAPPCWRRRTRRCNAPSQNCSHKGECRGQPPHEAIRVGVSLIFTSQYQPPSPCPRLGLPPVTGERGAMLIYNPCLAFEPGERLSRRPLIIRPHLLIIHELRNSRAHAPIARQNLSSNNRGEQTARERRGIHGCISQP